MSEQEAIQDGWLREQKDAKSALIAGLFGQGLIRRPLRGQRDAVEEAAIVRRLARENGLSSFVEVDLLIKRGEARREAQLGPGLSFLASEVSSQEEREGAQFAHEGDARREVGGKEVGSVPSALSVLSSRESESSSSPDIPVYRSHLSPSLHLLCTPSLRLSLSFSSSPASYSSSVWS